MAMDDLFASHDLDSSACVERRTPPQADLLFYPGFFGADESQRYFSQLSDSRCIHWQQETAMLYGRQRPIPRLTAWYGDTDKTYTYSGMTLYPHPWTDALIAIKKRVESVAGVRFTSVLLNLYRDGRDSVSWHSDDEPELGDNPIIASVSFGETREFQLRHKHYRRNALPVERFALSSGSLLLMRGETQHYWQHQLPKRVGKNPYGPRVNLTFRRIV